MKINQLIARPLWFGLILSLVFEFPVLASAAPVIVQLCSAESGLLADSPSRRLVDQAQIKARKGERQGALKDLEKALRIDPRNFWAFMARTIILLQMEDLQGVIDHTTRAIEINPGDPDNWSSCNLRSFAHHLLRQYKQAAQDWYQARQFNPPPRSFSISIFTVVEMLSVSPAT